MDEGTGSDSASISCLPDDETYTQPDSPTPSAGVTTAAVIRLPAMGTRAAAAGAAVIPALVGTQRASYDELIPTRIEGWKNDVFLPPQVAKSEIVLDVLSRGKKALAVPGGCSNIDDYDKEVLRGLCKFWLEHTFADAYVARLLELVSVSEPLNPI